jgi:hypothetical protein
MSRRTFGALVLLASLALIWLGTQILDQAHGRDPGGKLFLAGWLSSELWVNPWLVVVGIVGVAAAVILLVYRGTRSET